jgi:glycosyltransferase involved in cell wall biosynthesis
VTTVAVCVPTIPARRTLLDRAFRSVSDQTRPADRFLVALDDVGDGAAPTRNRAWQMSDHDWLAFLDDDDEFKPEHLERLLGCAEDTGADLVYPWFELVDRAGNAMNERDPLRIVYDGRSVSPLGLPFGEQHVEELYHRNNFIPVTVLVRRQLVEDVGGFPTPRTAEWPEDCCEDWGLWRRLLDAGATFAHHPERTWRWYWHGKNTSGKPWKKSRK